MRHETRSVMSANCLSRSLWWHVYPLGFVGADTSGHDRSCRRPLSSLIQWLDYAADLSMTGLALGPIFQSRSHGYDTLDYYTIDERLGTRADFDALVAACRQRQFALILDGVFNHVSHHYPAFLTAVETGDDQGLFTLYPNQDRYDYDMFEGNHDLVELRSDSAQVRALITDVICHWLDAGADGFRLDAAYAKAPDFWRPIINEVKARFPEAIFFGEVIHGDYPRFVCESGVDSLTQYELWKALWSSLKEKNFFELDHALSRHNSFLEVFPPVTFTSNHDVTRIATTLDNPALHAQAVVVQFTVGGIPLVYYGDEQAYRGTKHARFRGDEEVRPPFPDSPLDFAEWGWPTYRHYQKLARFRLNNPWLTRAKTETIHLTNEQYCYRTWAGENELVVGLNLADTDVTIPTRSGHEVRLGTGDCQGGQLHLPALGWAICSNQSESNPSSPTR